MSQETKLARYDKKLEKMEDKKEIYDKKSEIKEVKKSMSTRKKLTTTKILMIYIFVNCTAVEIYSMIAMYMLMDLSALYALVSAVVTESISFAIYAAKSYNETKQEELVKLEYEKLEYEYQNTCEDTEPDREGAMG